MQQIAYCLTVIALLLGPVNTLDIIPFDSLLDSANTDDSAAKQVDDEAPESISTTAENQNEASQSFDLLEDPEKSDDKAEDLFDELKDGLEKKTPKTPEDGDLETSESSQSVLIDRIDDLEASASSKLTLFFF